MDEPLNYFVLIFLVLLIVYNLCLTTTLPPEIQRILRNPITKIAIITLIFLFAMHYPTVAILLLIAYVLSHTYSNTSNSADSIVAMAGSTTEEKYSDYGRFNLNHPKQTNITIAELGTAMNGIP